MDEESRRRQLANKKAANNKTHPNLIEDDAPITPSPAPPQHSRQLALPQFSRPNSAIFVKSDAIYEMLAHAMEAPKRWVPEKFTEERSKPEYVNPQEYCTDVTHPKTGETITSYKILMQIPALMHVWDEAMCKELSKITNGWKEIEGTQTVRFLTHEEISAIPRNRTITYARIVID